MHVHQHFHTQFGFCLWDIAALIAFAAVVAILAIHNARQKKREQDFESELSEKLARESVSENEQED